MGYCELTLCTSGRKRGSARAKVPRVRVDEDLVHTRGKVTVPNALHQNSSRPKP